MKLFLKFVVPIAATILAVALAFAFLQSHQERIRLEREMERRAGLLCDSLIESLQPYARRNSTEGMKRLAEKFSRRGRLKGIAVVSQNGTVLAVSSALERDAAIVDSARAVAAGVAGTATVSGRFAEREGGFWHVYAVHVPARDGVRHALVLFQDAGDIPERVARIWQHGFLRAFVQASFVSLILLLVVYLYVLAPIRRTVEWIRGVRRGDRPEPPREHVFIASLAREVSEMAKSLQMARLAAEEEARLRHSAESHWTPERLKEFARSKLSGRQLYVVSNREPYQHIQKGREIECIVPASGLVTAIEPVLKACGGTWVAMAAGDADRLTVDEQDHIRVPPSEPVYTLRRVWVPPEEEAGYYYGFSNEGLWPLCHVAHTRPVFREKDWIHYESANRRFADALCGEMRESSEPCVLIQDYHFALLPRMTKSLRPDARVAIFWHIPWPNPESFGICPWQKEILRGMLGADLIGFHTQYHCNNFIETVDRALESRIDYEHFTVNREGQTTWVKPFPISIDFTGEPEEPAVPPAADARSLLKPHGLEAELLGVGVDRLDYTKGIVERLRGVERFLEHHPSYERRFTFVELGAPSRTLIPRYGELVAEIEREVGRINGKYRHKDWKPLLFLKKHHSHAEIRPFYEAAHVCLVTSLHDGMNLVAKEFVASRRDAKGVLVLSQFTGASRDLRDALIVNPYDIGQVAEAIRTAIEMPVEEQRRRMSEMRRSLRERNIYRWAADLIGELAQVRIGAGV